MKIYVFKKFTWDEFINGFCNEEFVVNCEKGFVLEICCNGGVEFC